VRGCQAFTRPVHCSQNIHSRGWCWQRGTPAPELASSHFLQTVPAPATGFTQDNFRKTTCTVECPQTGMALRHCCHPSGPWYRHSAGGRRSGFWENLLLLLLHSRCHVPCLSSVLSRRKQLTQRQGTFSKFWLKPELSQVWDCAVTDHQAYSICIWREMRKRQCPSDGPRTSVC
jgi:hypothetical protein